MIQSIIAPSNGLARPGHGTLTSRRSTRQRTRCRESALRHRRRHLQRHHRRHRLRRLRRPAGRQLHADRLRRAGPRRQGRQRPRHAVAVGGRTAATPTRSSLPVRPPGLDPGQLQIPDRQHRDRSRLERRLDRRLQHGHDQRRGRSRTSGARRRRATVTATAALPVHLARTRSTPAPARANNPNPQQANRNAPGAAAMANVTVPLRGGSARGRKASSCRRSNLT